MELLTNEQAQEILGKSKQAINRYGREGKLDRVKKGKEYMFTRASVLNLKSNMLEYKDDYLTTDQAADELCVSINTIYNYLYDGLLSGERCGKRIYIHKDEIGSFHEKYEENRGVSNWDPPEEEVEEMKEILLRLSKKCGGLGFLEVLANAGETGQSGCRQPRRGSYEGQR